MRELLVAAALVLSVDAHAASSPPAEDHPASPERALPDYRGAPDPAPTPGQDLLWAPRILLFPPYLVSEYVIRRPLGALVSTAEREGWQSTLYDLFTFGPEHNAGLVPTAFFDFGMRPSVGLYFFWDKAFFPENDLRARVGYFGSDWVSLGLLDRIHTSKTTSLALDIGWLRRPDQIYAGEGALTLNAAESRYFIKRFDVATIFDAHPVDHFSYEAKIGARAVTFAGSPVATTDEPSLPDQAALGAFPLPADYAQGYTEVYERMSFTLDSRGKAATSKTGLRLHGFVEHGTDVRHGPGSQWLKSGATAGAYADIWRQRVLGLTFWAERADSVHGGTIPFTEEVVWGGAEPMSGLLPGRLHGRSAVAAQLSYSWPIWVFLDGSMRASVGNVFDADLSDFSVQRLRASAGIGAQSSGSADHRLEFLVGFASETFEQGGKIDSFRLYIGGTNGF